MLPEFGTAPEAPHDGVNLLVSLLVRYPEIATLAYEPKQNLLTLKFMFKAIEDQDDVFGKIELLKESLAAFYALMKLQPVTAKMNFDLDGNIAILRLERDVATVTKNEIVLVVSFLREQMQGLLLADLPPEQSFEESGFQDELIENMLRSIESNYHGQGLLGIREEGRVLVFNK